MGNVYDYIKYYKAYTFSEIPFNDIDNIIFSILSYLPLEKIDYKDDMTLDEIISKLNMIKINEKSLGYKSIKVLELIKNTERYKSIKLLSFDNVLDDSTQFSAITIKFDNYIYVSFRGTDSSIIGWKEDFELSYNYPTNAQKKAIKYLDEVSNYANKIIIGGHSKGGNLAIASAVEASDEIKKKITKIYNNDGPGFLINQIDSQNFKKISNKIVTIIPEESLVGIILDNINIRVVKSSNKHFSQHDLTSWNCFGSVLINATQSSSSLKYQNKIKKWIEKTSEEDRKRVVESFFDIMRIANIKEFRDLKNLSFVQLKVMFKETNNIRKSDEKIVFDTLKEFFKS